MNLVDEIYNVLVERFGVGEVCIKKYDKRPETTWKEFINICIAPGYLVGTPLAKRLGFADISGLSRYLNKNQSVICLAKQAGIMWHTYFLSLINMKVCVDCQEIIPYTKYSMDNSTYSKLKNICTNCASVRSKVYRDNNQEHLADYKERTKEARKLYLTKYCNINRDKRLIYSRNHYLSNKAYYNAKNAKRRATKLKATPNWADLEAIKEIYISCPKGYHVDHIVPLQSDLVCGLHCEFNLQHLNAHDNLSKGNRFEIC